VIGRDLVWYLAFGMAAATVATILVFSRRVEHPKAFRAQDNPPPVLQIMWPILFVGPQGYPFLMILAPAFAYETILTLSFPLDQVIQVVGLLVWVAGGLLVLSAGRALGRFMTIQIVVANDHELITMGPYARIRHPTYTGAILLTIGMALVFLNVLLMAAAPLVVAVANYRARKEERLLASPEGFGAEYRQYMARTGRFLPSLRRA
jgi:protein-S-isoprenylcysteine O-methyltransferase Ste14